MAAPNRTELSSPTRTSGLPAARTHVLRTAACRSHCNVCGTLRRRTGKNQWRIEPTLERNRAPLHAARMWCGCGARCRSNTRLPRMGAERLWNLLHGEAYVRSLGALTGNQAVQQVQAGLKAIYLSGWQVAADANLARADVSRPEPLSGQQRSHVVRAINNALLRADQIHHAEGKNGTSLVRADRGRCRSRLRRHPERFRADEGHDRGRRRRRALRRSALLREEVRPPGRQGAGADLASSSRSWSRPAWRPTCWACRRS